MIFETLPLKNGRSKPEFQPDEKNGVIGLRGCRRNFDDSRRRAWWRHLCQMWLPQNCWRKFGWKNGFRGCPWFFAWFFVPLKKTSRDRYRVPPSLRSNHKYSKLSHAALDPLPGHWKWHPGRAHRMGQNFFCPIRCALSCCHEILEWPWVYFSLTLLPTGVVLWSKTRASKRMEHHQIQEGNRWNITAESIRRFFSILWMTVVLPWPVEDFKPKLTSWPWCCGIFDSQRLEILTDSQIAIRFCRKVGEVGSQFWKPRAVTEASTKKTTTAKTYLHGVTLKWLEFDGFFDKLPAVAHVATQKPPGDSVWPRPRIFQSTQPVFCAMNLQSNLGRLLLVWLASLITSVTSVK